MAPTCMFFCPLCGVPVNTYGNLSSTLDADQELRNQQWPWLGAVRYLYPENIELSGNVLPDTTDDSYIPYLTPPGQLCIEGYRSNCRLPDRNTGQYHVQNFSLKENLRKRDGSTTYPIHDACWQIFYSILSEFLKDQPPKTPLVDLMQTVYRILDNSANKSGRIMWSHGYYGLAKYIITAGWELPVELDYVASNPWDLNSKELEMWSSTNIFQRRIMLSAVSSLPPEIIEQIYGLLSLKDLGSLLGVSSKSSIELSDSFWKCYFKPSTAELGYLCLNEENNKVLSKLPWIHKIKLARRVSEFPPGMRNRHRIWKICRGLVDQLFDIVTSDMLGLQDLEREANAPPLSIAHSTHALTQPDQMETDVPGPGRGGPSFLVQGVECSYNGNSDQDGTVATYGGCIDSTGDSMLELSYCGDSESRYLSGLTLIPSGKSLGSITNRRRAIHLNRDARFLSVAHSRYGIVDVSLSHDPDKPNWYGDQLGLSDRLVAISRRFLDSMAMASSEEVFVKIYLECDVVKITRISFEGNFILGPLALGEQMKSGNVGFVNRGLTITADEAFVESYRWVPEIPPQKYSLNVNYQNEESDDDEDDILPFSVMQQAILPNVPLTMITGHVESNYLIGISFHFENPSMFAPVTIGNREGAFLDFLIDGKSGESLSAVEFIKFSDFSQGLVIKTTRGRMGLFSHREYKDEPFEIRRLETNNDSKILGFYGMHVPGSSIKTFGSIGVISSQKLAESYLKQEAKAQHKLHNEVASDVPMRSFPIDIRQASAGQFSNTTSFHLCRRITAYHQRVPRKRLRGLLLEYDDRPPQILGQISFADPDPNPIEFGNDETAANMEFYVRRPQFRTKSTRMVYATGLKVLTTAGKTYITGDNAQLLDPFKFSFESDSILRWDFNELFDSFSVSSATTGNSAIG